MTKEYLGQRKDSRTDIIAGVIFMVASFLSIIKIEVVLSGDVQVRVRVNGTGFGIFETFALNLPLLIPICFALFSICFAKKKGMMLSIPYFIWAGGALLGDIYGFVFTPDNAVMEIITRSVVMCAHIALIMVMTLTFYGVIKNGRMLGFTILISITVKLICVILLGATDTVSYISITGILAHILFCIGLVALSFSLERFTEEVEPAKAFGAQSAVAQPTASAQKPELTYCTNCGAPLAKDSKFCTKCGSNV
ncbi:MAG: zinc-ribbon domain-containing protein [Ruminococcus sp.]|nr:zinc-ribbon domain-containing protein [Ruminococcus sp.]